MQEAWYRQPSTFSEALQSAGNINVLARQTGVARSTLQEWRRKHGIETPQQANTSAPKFGEQVSSEEVLLQENRELKSQLTQTRKREVFDYRIAKMLEANVACIEPDYVPLALPVDESLTPHTHALQWSDIHAAEVVSYEAMNGLNEYNWAIMEQRHHTLARAIRSFKKNRPYPIPTLHIWGLGDMVTGDIHDELRETNEVVITESAVKLGYFMADFVATELVPLYEKIVINAVVGNHGRTSRKPEFKNANKNWDWVTYKIMELRLAEFSQVSVSLPTGFEQVVEVEGRNVLLFHGDGVQSNMPGVPWGGITRRTKELASTYAAQGIYLDHYACGHYHEANVTGQKRILMNGSIKGPDEYSLKRFGGGQPACQLLHTFHPTRGLVGTDYLTL